MADILGVCVRLFIVSHLHVDRYHMLCDRTFHTQLQSSANFFRIKAFCRQYIWSPLSSTHTNRKHVPHISILTQVKLMQRQLFSFTHQSLLHSPHTQKLPP